MILLTTIIIIMLFIVSVINGNNQKHMSQNVSLKFIISTELNHIEREIQYFYKQSHKMLYIILQ